MDDHVGAASGSTWPHGRSRDGGVDEIHLPAAPDGSSRGRLWLCGKHAVAPDPQALLVALGASAVVCLNERFELAERYPHYVTWLEQHGGDRALWFPVPDLHAPPLAPALELLDDLRCRLDLGRSLLVHCGAGIGRAGTVAACLLILMGVAEHDALEMVAVQRPMAGPEAGAQRALVAEVSAWSRSWSRSPSPERC